MIDDSQSFLARAAAASSDRLDLTGCRVLVTGSSKNLGRSMVELMSSRGASVIVHGGHDRGSVDDVTAGIALRGGHAIGVVADLSSPDDVSTMVEEVDLAFGGVDVLVNNAAIRPHSRFATLELDEWRNVIAVNLDAVFLLSKAFVPEMAKRGWGRVINVSGMDAFWGKPGKAHTVVCNLGTIGFIRSLAVEYAKHGVTANAVVPGAMLTERRLDDYPEFETRFARVLDRVPMGRAGTPAELAEVVAFLASPAASYVTAQTIHVSGGAVPTTTDPMENSTASAERVAEFVSAAKGEVDELIH